MIKIAIVDDNTFLVNSTKEKLSFFKDFEIKFTTNNGKEAIEKLQLKSNIDLILMDIEMPEMDGIEATAIIKSKFPHIKIIMLTVFENDENIFNAIKAGADGYLLKEISPDDIYRSIVETYNGGASMTPSIAQKTLRMFREPFDIENFKKDADISLTTRESEVLLQLSTGIKYELIANNLNISSGTVRKHIENIYTKLQVCNKLEAIQKAKSNKLI
ncbi:MAG: response regulator transcription factor [Paludibacter sp.]|jgi:DNA-binding NarL/FixJ family response regulator|nr:response regulator transcription factor [Paludibacter sp.]